MPGSHLRQVAGAIPMSQTRRNFEMCRGPLQSGLAGGLPAPMPPAFEQVVSSGHHGPFGVDLVPAAMPHPRPAELFDLAEHRLDHGLAARVKAAAGRAGEPFDHSGS